ncbi:MAG: PEGA domain-containing protein [Trueperaceae bacterium]|nr:PEGA domain-containing protein [Trueperaceae bacterium]
MNQLYRPLRYTFALLIALVVGLGSAQDNVVISPQSIVVNPQPSFDVDVFVDKDRTGEAAPVYDIGEEIRIGVTVNEDAYIYLFNVRSNGAVTRILPNRLDEASRNNFVRAGETRFFPPPDARYTFNVDGPRGLDKVIALASQEQIDTSALAQFQAESDFAESVQSEESFAQTLSIVVNPLPQNEWVTDTALFYVGQRPATPVYGTIDIRSNPSGARAFVDGQFVGTTPVSFSPRAGEHSVRIERADFETFTTTVNVRGGQTLQISAQLEPVVRTGTASFESVPSGADVFVGGEFIGTTPTGRVTLEEGSYQARFSLPGYQDATLRFQITRNSNQLVRAELVRSRGQLTVQSNLTGARVFINGDQVGTTGGNGNLTVGDLPVGFHQVVVLASGYNAFVTEFEIRAGQNTTVSASLSRR